LLDWRRNKRREEERKVLTALEVAARQSLYDAIKTLGNVGIICDISDRIELPKIFWQSGSPNKQKFSAKALITLLSFRRDRVGADSYNTALMNLVELFAERTRRGRKGAIVALALFSEFARQADSRMLLDFSETAQVISSR